jgi:hypothetical protein
MTHKQPRIRRWIQASLLVLGATGLAQCVDGTVAPGGSSTFNVAPVWKGNASATLAILDEGGLPLDRVRIVLIRPVSDTVKDTTVTVHRGDPQIDLPLVVNVTPGVSLLVTLQFKSGETILFEGSATVETVPMNRPNPIPASLPMVYIGPGSNATRVVVTPSSGAFQVNAPVTFTAVAFAVDTPLPNTPIEWSSSDETVGNFTTPGVFTPTSKGGPVTITAKTPTGITGTANISMISAAPSAITIVSGNGQVDDVLKILPNPFVVKVADAVGNGLPGVTVNWQRIGGFGTPATATSTTNSSGNASLSYRLGDIGGADTVEASVTGVATRVRFIVGVRDGNGQPVATGFAYLRVTPSPVSPRVGDTIVFAADSVSAGGQTAPVTALWASSNPGRGPIEASGRMITADTGSIIVTATRNGLVGHARVTVLPAPLLKTFTFSPKTLNGITNSALTTSVSFSVVDAGSGITSATVTLTGPTGTTRTCTINTPTTGTARNGIFDCAMTLPAGSPAGTWRITSLVLNGSITRTFGESVLALFGTTTLTVNP